MQETCGVLTKRVRWPMMHREINIWSCFFFPLEFILTSLDILKYLKRISLKHVKHLKSWVVWVRKKLKKTWSAVYITSKTHSICSRNAKLVDAKNTYKEVTILYPKTSKTHWDRGTCTTFWIWRVPSPPSVSLTLPLRMLLNISPTFITVFLCCCCFRIMLFSDGGKKVIMLNSLTAFTSHR